MKRPASAALALLAALSACSNEPDYAAAAKVDAKQAQVQARIDHAVAAGGVRQMERTGLPVATPTPSAARARALPPAFQGYWGVTPDDCELANYAATGRIDVDADTIRFFEAKGRVQELTERSPTIVDTVLRVSAEGRDETRRTRLVLEAGGTHLVRIEQAPAATTRYQKC